MADNNILAGRLTVDVSEFTRKIGNAVTEANKQIARVGKDTGSGSSAQDSQLQKLKAMEQEVKKLASAYKEFNNSGSVQNIFGKGVFGKAIDEARTKINEYYRDLMKLGDGTEETAKIKQRASEAFRKAENLILTEAKKSADAQQKAADKAAAAIEKMRKEEERAEKAMNAQVYRAQREEINKVASAYQTLKTGISEYNKAKKQGDSQGMQYWQQQITASKQVLDTARANIDELGLEESQRQKVLNIIQQSETAMRGFNNQQSQSQQFADGLANQWTKLWGIMKLLSGFSIYKIFGEATNYAKQFDAAMTDIDVITKGTTVSTSGLGGAYRKLANDLRVSSTEIAQANATIFRQGFTNSADAQAVTVGATKFGAVTGIGTAAAIQNMTAAIQNFREEGDDIGEFVMHLGDVWSYMGDTVATTGEEISAAMGKTSASIQSVGVSMEKASSWAAIMLAKTQQSGQVIGTNLNSLVARYAKVTSKGYAAVTSDDDGEALNFNDVSKALAAAGIKMYDVATQTFLPMNEMMDQLAAKWDTLDEAQRKYIATTLGGTRGMNYLLTLLDNYNAALELEEGIIDGIVDQKYEAWMNGVEAAQNNLTNSMENLYSYMSRDVMTGFYNGLAGLVDMFTAATDALGGLNLTIPAIAAGILAVVSAISKLKTILTAGNLIASLSSGSIGLIVGSLAILGTAIGAIKNAIDGLDQRANSLEKIRDQIQVSQSEVDKWTEYSRQLNEFQTDVELTTEQTDQLNTLLNAIGDDSPSIKAAFEQMATGADKLAAAQEIVNDRLLTTLKLNASLRREQYLESKDNLLKQYNAIKGAPGGGSELWFEEYLLGSSGLGAREFETYDSYSQGAYIKSFIDNMLPSADLLNGQTISGLNDIQVALDHIIQASIYKNTPIEVQDYVDSYYASLKSAIYARSDELKEIKNELRDIIIGAFTSADQVNMMQDDTGFMDQILDMFLDTDAIWTDEGQDKVRQVGHDIWQAYADLFTDGISVDEIKTLNEAYTKAISAGLVGSKDNVLSNMLDSIIENMSKAINMEGLPPELDNELYTAISTRWTPEILNAFNKAVDALPEDAGDDVLVQLVKKWVGMSENELQDAVNEIIPTKNTEEPSSGESDKTSYSEKIRAAINDVKELQQAIESLRNTPTEEIDTKLFEKIANAYPQLKEAIQAYADAFTSGDSEAITSTANALADMMQMISDNAEGFAGIEQIETIRGYIEKLTSGEYNVDELATILELIGTTGEELKNLTPEQILERLNHLLDEQIEKWGDLARQLGLMKEETDDYAQKVDALLHPMNEVEQAMQKLREGDRLTLDEVEMLIKKYPDLADEIAAYAQNTENAGELLNALSLYNATDEMNAWGDAVESAVKKLDGLDASTREYANAMVELSNSFDFQGMGTLSNLDFVTQNLDIIRDAAYGSADAFRALQEAAWINIVGTSDVDFSTLQNGIYAVDEMAIQAFNILQALGLGTVEYQDMNGYGQTLSYLADGTAIMQTIPLNGRVAYWKPSAKSPLSGSAFKTTSTTSSTPRSSGSNYTPRSSSSTPRSSSSSSDTIKVSDRTQSMLNSMSEGQTNFSNRLKLIQLKNEYHDIRGELQGVIGYTRLEADTITQQNKALEENIKKLDDEIAAKKEIIARNHSSSTTYKQAAVDLAELNKTHKDYTEQLQNNKNRLESLRKELDKLDEEARQSTITVQELIRKTIVGQKQYERDMLEGTIALEDKILDVIQKRYERERDLAIETANAKKDALQEEIDKIDEAIDARRKLLEKEDKSKEIAELQAKIARISTDPTRRKEAMQLEAELAEKQKELAWDTYEEELNAQKDSLDKQMDNIDDYIDYVREYYEDLFEHPKKLITEMQDVIQRSDTEIVDWLKANSEEWADYTDAKRQKTEEDWLEMVHNMRGVSETYQKEIEEIMSWTDAEIIEWLKKNNVEFKNATKEQQDSFLYSWKESLNNWRNAYKNIVAEINATTYSAPTVTYLGGGGYSGGTSYSGGTTYSGGGYSGGTYASTPVSTPASSSSSSGSSSSGGYQISQYGNTSLFTAAAQEYSQPTSYTAYAKWGFYRPNGQYDYEQEWQTGAYANRGTLKETAKNIAKVRAYNRLKDEWYDAAFRSHTKSVADYKEAMKYINSGNNSAYLWLEQSYKKGGIADFTGPAWLDGTPSAPERVLSAEQTALFETLVKSLQAIKTVSVSGLSGGGDMSALGGANISIEQILIQPQSLDEDADYDLIAERVGQSIMDGLNRTMAIGGIRI